MEKKTNDTGHAERWIYAVSKGGPTVRRECFFKHLGTLGSSVIYTFRAELMKRELRLGLTDQVE